MEDLDEIALTGAIGTDDHIQIPELEIPDLTEGSEAFDGNGFDAPVHSCKLPCTDMPILTDRQQMVKQVFRFSTNLQPADIINRNFSKNKA